MNLPSKEVMMLHVFHVFMSITLLHNSLFNMGQNRGIL